MPQTMLKSIGNRTMTSKNEVLTPKKQFLAKLVFFEPK